jgi:hypothetical protein
MTQAWHSQFKGDIFSWCERFYLDMANKAGDPSTHNWCGDLRLDEVYNAPTSGAGIAWKGVEAPLWGEFTRYPLYTDRQLWPRSAAVAEVWWAPDNNNFDEFKGRIAPFGKRFDAMGMTWYANEGMVSWERGTVAEKAASVFGGFKPELLTPVRTARIAAAQNYRSASGNILFDLHGRIAGTHKDARSGILAEQNNLARGVYFCAGLQNGTKLRLIR